MHPFNVKVSIRSILRQKGYTFINVLGLAVGIASCLLILLYVHDELSYDDFNVHADRIYRVLGGSGGQLGPITSPAIAPDLKDAFPEVEQATRLWISSTMTVRYDQQAYTESGIVYADPDFFTMFSYRFLEGSPDHALDRPFSIVLTASAARRYFGDQNPLGKTLTLNNADDFEVTAVVADVPTNTHLPFDFVASITSVDWLMTDNWLSNMARNYVMLRDPSDAPGLTAKLPDLVQQKAGEQLARYGWSLNLALQPLRDIHLQPTNSAFGSGGGAITYVYLFSTIALLVLVVACINYVNLATARSMRRAREVGVRKVLGARRWQLAWQFFGESVLVTCAALVLAVGLALFARPVFNQVAGKSFTAAAFGQPFVLVSLVGLGGVVSVVAGGYPALLLSGYRPVRALKGRLAAVGSAGVLRKGLVVFQFAVAVFLIVGTSIVYQQLQYAQKKDLGYDREHVVVLPMYDEAVREAFPTLKSELGRMPNVRSVTALSNLPGNMTRSNVVDGEGLEQQGSARLSLRFVGVDVDALRALEIPMVEGSDPADLPRAEGPPAEGRYRYVLNEAAVRHLGWTDDDAVGRWISMAGDGRRGTVVGVMRDFHGRSLRSGIEPLAFVVEPDWFHHLLVKIGPGDTAATLQRLQARWHALLPQSPFDYTFLDQEYDRLYRTDRRVGRLYATFSTLAIVIACLGLFGLASYAAERRTKEIGVRKVMGASVRSIVLLLSKDFARLVLVGFVVASPIAYYVMHRWLDEFAFRTSISPSVFLVAGIATLALALITVASQTVRAAAKDPVKALRYE